MSYRIETQHRKGAHWTPLTASFATEEAAKKAMKDGKWSVGLSVRVAEYEGFSVRKRIRICK